MDTVEEFIKFCIESILENDCSGINLNEVYLTNIGMDSVANFQLMVQLEGEYGIFFEDEEITEETFLTVNSLANIVKEKLVHA
ncbi:acyl carrier protein [Paenibacillus sp. KN14-4R]|uniref:acyl carrier protein n=1 Tax=Paenibacillus sp. KN14-4R TaxID=3445773 RepID=UPI003FA05379